jgi:hypothetical protein
VCTSGCPTKDCPSYAACLRGKGTKVAYANSAGGWDATGQKKWDSELSLYREARAEGIQPASTKRTDVERALRISDTTGKAHQA